jgi:acylphosphatase
MPGIKRRRLQVFYSGRVQGVGFRYQTKRLADGYELTGVVRNLADGRVELVAEGRDEELAEFRQAIRESGLGPLIREETEFWSESLGEFRSFEIVR